MMDGPSLVTICEMPYSLRWNNPRYWHRRAEEARTVGEGMSNIEARTDMLRVAADYEVMAQRVPGALYHQDELLTPRRGPACGLKFQCPSRKDLFEARMRISSQHTASAATASSLDSFGQSRNFQAVRGA
jgi:hypothetical protein